MAKPTLTHPALDQIAATSEILRSLLSGVDEQQSMRKPDELHWSVAEVLEHLSHVEGHCFRTRLDRILSEDNPVFGDYDQEAIYREGTYSGREPEESFAHWEEQRDDALELLAELDPIVLTRKGRHAQRGEFTLEELLNAWAYHDLSHIRQMADLVRNTVYKPNTGIFGR